MAGEVLSKKLRPVIHTAEVDPAADGLAGVMGKAASVVGLASLNVQLEAHSRAAKKCTPVDFIEELPENGIYLKIECETEDQIGILAINPALVNTIGNVLTGTLVKDGEMPPRPPTAIDEALCRPFLDAMLMEFSDILRELRNGKITSIYQTSTNEKEPSPHLFPEIPYLELSIDFDFMKGAGSGQLSIMLPVANTDFTSALPRPGETASAWRENLHRSIDAAPARFDVVLCRKKMPIGQILKLKTGDVLTIPARSLENLTLEVHKGKRSQSLMRARLGEYQEMRAAKVVQIGEMDSSLDETKLIGSGIEG